MGTNGAAYAAAARRSLRVTLAAGAGFYLFLYGFGQSVAATYALFAAVALAGLSRIPGTGRQRAAVLLRLLPAAWLLVVVGTFLAVRTWSAVAGMLVIGFALAFVAAGGPRPAGAAPGLQLLYILPSFPPYAPDTLGERLVGTTTGILLLVIAEALVLPDPPTVPYRELAARAAVTAERCAGELARAPYELSPAAGAAATAAAMALRPSKVPEAERPAGPGVRSRGLAHAGLAARTLLNRLGRLPAPPPGRAPTEAGLGLLRAVGRSAADSAALLRGVSGAGTADSGPGRERALLAAAPAAGPRRRSCASGRTCWSWPTPRWRCPRPRGWPYGGGRPCPACPSAGSGTRGCGRRSCGGGGWWGTRGAGRSSSRTRYGSVWRWPPPGPSPDWPRCRTASGRCWRRSRSPAPPSTPPAAAFARRWPGH